MANMIKVTIIDTPLFGASKNKKISINADNIECIEDCTKDEKGVSKIIMKGLLSENYHVNETQAQLEKLIKPKQSKAKTTKKKK